MKHAKLSAHKLLWLGILGLILLLGACSQQPTTTNQTNPGGNASQPTATPTTATDQSSASSGSSVTYANVKITLLSVEQKTSFADDNYTTNSQLVRINFKEENPTTNDVFIFYDDSMRLILPSGSVVKPTKTLNYGDVGQAVIRNNWVDFAVDSKQDISKLVWRIGTDAENYINFPLKSNPDLSKYQDKSISPNKKVQYMGMNWTITKVTATLSDDGKQATKGNHYIVVSLTVDNPTKDDLFPFPDTNIRLKSSSATQAPTNSTLPSNFAAGSTNGKGTLSFLMPEKDTNLTLEFLAQSSQNVKAASTSFQI